MYILEGGGNDILGTTTGSPQTLANQIATRIVDCTIKLRRAGAKHFIIPNLFDVGLVPAAAGKESFATTASKATNEFVNSLLVLEDNQPGSQILRMDVFALLNAVQIVLNAFTTLVFGNLAAICCPPLSGSGTITLRSLFIGFVASIRICPSSGPAE